jgi:peptidoglycan/xylan/chitin deacetylase (PgdA/CDA1 family)
MRADYPKQLQRCIDSACADFGGQSQVFFRDDDVAVPGIQFEKMMRLFGELGVPLCPALVPSWLTTSRWRRIRELFDPSSSLWCWHQHGWRHVDHEKSGKKQEFGPSRSDARLTRDLRKGRARLEDIVGKHFYPVFTPPWNRCSDAALKIIKDLGYKAVSRIRGAPPPGVDLKDVAVDVDLHTRKDTDGHIGWNTLLQEFETGIRTGRCGIMLHHRRMNAAAFDFLEVLLKVLVAHPHIRLVNFRDLLE